MKKEIKQKPLADSMRPKDFGGFVGQEKILDKEKILRKIIDSDKIPSMIFWGPPGSGKTTLAGIIANETQNEFIKISAINSGVKDLRREITKAEELKKIGKTTILFIDEIHRFNKSQQDFLLPYVENGSVVLIGATTENPSFEVNRALLSRLRVFILDMLSTEDLEKILKRALEDKKDGLGKKNIEISEENIKFIAEISSGDARSALNILEMASNINSKIDLETIKQAAQKNIAYDKDGENHYNLISALHKSMRGSDADASLYYLVRMLEGGEDPLYIARRLIRFASEDIGIANSAALTQAVAAYDACHYTGMPECGINLAQAVVYMAKSKKSNALYKAYKEIQEDVRKTGNLPVPIHLINASTKLMKKMGFGEGYKYSPDFNYKEDQNYMPDRLSGKKYLDY